MKPRQVFHGYRGISPGERDLVKFCPRCGSGLITRTDAGRPRKACAACGFVHYFNPAPAVCVLVVDGDRFLLCRRNKRTFAGGKWCLPSGFVEFDEDYLTAARREVEEETGVPVEICAILSVVTNYLAPTLHTIVPVLLARPLAGPRLKPRPQENEIDAVRWVGSRDRLPSMAFEADAHIIRRYFATELPGAPVDARYAGPGKR